jgi:hypothetical protein
MVSIRDARGLIMSADATVRGVRVALNVRGDKS